MRCVYRGIVPGVIGAVVIMLSVFSAVPSSVAQATPSTPAWAVVPTPGPTSSYNQLSGVSCASKNACMAVGTSHAAGYSMFAEQWDGLSWTLEQLPPLPTASEMGELSGVACVTKNACMAVGYIQKGNGSTLPLTEFWDGTSWTAQTALPVPKSSTSSVRTRETRRTRDSVFACARSYPACFTGRPFIRGSTPRCPAIGWRTPVCSSIRSLRRTSASSRGASVAWCDT